MKRDKTSGLWAYFTCQEGAEHIALCTLCNKTISRGKAGCTQHNNGGMIHHLERIHKDQYMMYKLGQTHKKVDMHDDTVRGTIPLFKLKNHTEGQEFLKLVC